MTRGEGFAMTTRERQLIYDVHYKCQNPNVKGSQCQNFLDNFFIRIAPENPVLWTGMKGVSAKGRKNLNQMLKRVQHDNRG